MRNVDEIRLLTNSETKHKETDENGIKREKCQLNNRTKDTWIDHIYIVEYKIYLKQMKYKPKER